MPFFCDQYHVSWLIIKYVNNTIDTKPKLSQNMLGQNCRNLSTGAYPLLFIGFMFGVELFKGRVYEAFQKML